MGNGEMGNGEVNRHPSLASYNRYIPPRGMSIPGGSA